MYTLTYFQSQTKQELALRALLLPTSDNACDDNKKDEVEKVKLAAKDETKVGHDIEPAVDAIVRSIIRGLLFTLLNCGARQGCSGHVSGWSRKGLQQTRGSNGSKADGNVPL